MTERADDDLDTQVLAYLVERSMPSLLASAEAELVQMLTDAYPCDDDEAGDD